MGWRNGWNYRYPIDVQHANIDGNLTDFPTYIKIDDGGLSTIIGKHGLATGNDLRFTQSDGVTLLKYEREYFNVAASVATGHLWVKIPSLLAASGGRIYCYFGGPGGIGDSEDAVNVWDANFKGVWHLNETYNVVAGHYKDSSGNGNHGTLQDSDADCSQQNGKIYKGLELAGGNDDFLDIGIDGSLDTFGANQDFSISLWLNSDQEGWGGWFASGSAAAKGIAFMQLNTEKQYFASVNNTITPESTNVITLGSWQYLTVTADRNGNLVFYKNGTADGTHDISGTAAENWNRVDDTYKIGNDRSETSPEDGILDEVRLSSIVRPAAWVKFEHANMNEADNELTWGKLETPAAMMGANF